MMARKLFTVDQSFTIRQRGTILVPGLVPEGEERFRAGDALRLVYPDGSDIETTIKGLDLLNLGPQGETAVLVAWQESEVPIGTEVWSL
ncbi:MAG: hypothetical protein JNG89_00925 [Planctomycetaceae bacterium]|nr:hypothetical protein [Planctomycetaceae bacterium]